MFRHSSTYILVLTLLAVVSLACRRSDAPVADVSETAPAGWRPADAKVVRVDDANLGSGLAFIDTTGTISALGRLRGNVSDVYCGVFVAGTPGAMNVYSVDNPDTPLNATPFSDITDFRMGYAYATRPGNGLMIVNTRGAVVNLLPPYVMAVTVPDRPAGTVSFAFADFLADHHNFVVSPYASGGLSTPAGTLLFGELTADSVRIEPRPLSDGRFVVHDYGMNPYAEPVIHVVGADGANVFTLGSGERPATDAYSDGWLGINADSASRFVGLDGATVLDLPPGSVAVRRHGAAAIVRDSATGKFSLVRADAGGQVIADGFAEITPLDRADTGGRVCFRVRRNPAGPVDIIDDNGVRVNNLTWYDADRNIFWRNLVFVPVGSGRYRVANAMSGRVVGSATIIPVLAPDAFATVTTSRIDPEAVAPVLDGISSDGWEIDGSFYTASTTARLLARKADMTPVMWSRQISLTGRNALELKGLDGGRWFFSFHPSPVVRHDTVSGFFSFWSLLMSPPEFNADSRLRTITTHVNVPPRLRSQAIDAARAVILSQGYIGYADRPYMFRSGGDVYIYFVPSADGFYIVMAFGLLDYDAIVAPARTNPISTNL